MELDSQFDDIEKQFKKNRLEDRKHHHHRHKHHKKSLEHDMEKRRNSFNEIYDHPKIPAQRVSMEGSPCFYENITFGQSCLYDVPKLYQEFCAVEKEEEFLRNSEDLYDVPPKQNSLSFSQEPPCHLLSSIEEETNGDKDENYYQNFPIIKSQESDRDSDKGSSGYRSSPSSQSHEELYVSNTLSASLEDLNLDKERLEKRNEIEFEEFDIDERQGSKPWKINKSIEFYHETVRQRQPCRKKLPNFDGKKSFISVQQLCSKFESVSQSKNNNTEVFKMTPPAAKVFNPSALKHKNENKKFMVLASLTRRSANSLSKVLKDVSEVYKNSEDSYIHDFNHYSVPSQSQDTTLYLKKHQGSYWDPSEFIEEFYQCTSQQNEKSKASCSYMEGFLEISFSSRGRNCWSNDWKLKYFHLIYGVLTTYNDDSMLDKESTCYIYKSKVEEVSENIISLKDAFGKVIYLRASSYDAFNSWSQVLKYNSSKDYSNNFLTISFLRNEISIYTNVLVVDFGSFSIRAGIAGKIPTLPNLFFPSVMAVDKSNPLERYFGLDAFTPNIQSRCSLYRPILRSVSGKYGIDQIAFQGIFEKIFKDLSINPGDYEVQLCVPRLLTEKNKIALASILFEEFGVHSVNMGHQTLFSLWAYQSSNGVVVDIGERMDIVPFIQGYKVESGISRLDVGAPQLLTKIKMMTESNELFRNSPLFISSVSKDYICRKISEDSLYVARNFDMELENYRQNLRHFEYKISIGNEIMDKINLASERFEAVEGLFKPELWGLDQAGVHVLVHKAIREISVDLRKELIQNIYLSGGLTQISGFMERLELEMIRLNPNNKPKVHNSPYAYHASYLGAIAHSQSNHFRQTRLTLKKWHSSEGNLFTRLWTL